MKDRVKTKQMLIQELDLLKQRIKELEQSESGYQQTETKLHEVERRLHAIYEHSLDVIYTLDCDFRVTSVSNSVERHLGYRAEELVGRSFNDINVVAPESLEAAFKDTLQALAGNTVPTAEYVFIRKDGSRAIGEVSGSPLVEAGKIIGLISVARDITDRKRSEKVLRGSEERYRSLASSVDSMYLVDRDCRYMFMNEGCRRKFGVPLEDIIGKRYNDFHAEENSKLFAKTVEAVFETGNPIQMEHQSERDQSYLLRTFSPVMDQEGKSITAVTISSKDISDRKRAEEALRESEERFRKLADLTWEGILIHRRGIILDVNESILKMFGCPAEEVIGQSVLEFLAPESIEPALQKLKESIDAPQLYLKAKALRKDKTVFPIEVLGRPIRYKNLDARVMAIRDITDRKHAEEALQESEERYRKVADFTYAWEYWLAPDGKYVYVSPACERISGYRVEEFQQDQNLLEKIIHPDDKHRFVCHIRDMLQGKSDACELEFRIITRSDEDRWIGHECQDVYGRDGAYLGRRGSNHDITDRKRAEEALRESENRYRELSIIDNLTQLYNSRHFYQQLKMEIDRVDRYKQPLTLLLLDLDDFKQFNDAYGHIEGDGVLSRFGQVVKRCLRQTDSAYRYGGEEFTILLPMTTSKNSTVTVERIRAEFKKENFSPVAGKDVHMTVSIGLAQYQPQEDMKAFVNRVDQLMYQAKKNGKDRVCSES